MGIVRHFSVLLILGSVSVICLFPKPLSCGKVTPMLKILRSVVFVTTDKAETNGIFIWIKKAIRVIQGVPGTFACTKELSHK